MTLPELLVALVIAAVVMVALGQAVQFGLGTVRAQARIQSKWLDFPTVEDLLRTLIARMDPGMTRADPAFFEGGRHSVAFTTDLPESADTARLADVRLEVDGDHRLILRWAPPRATLVPPPGVVSLLEGVDRLDIAYWSEAQPGGAWVSVWEAPVPPRLIRLRITRQGDNSPGFPDIIATVERQRWRP